MTRLEKIQLAIEKGYTCNFETGEVFGPKGNLITTKHNKGYIDICFRFDKVKYHILAHHFIWYYVYRQVPYELDHINRNKHDNKISNLRAVTRQQNNFNRNAKGFTYNKRRKKYIAQIMLNYERIFLGLFNSSQEAKQAYLDAKQKYHVI